MTSYLEKNGNPYHCLFKKNHATIGQTSVAAYASHMFPGSLEMARCSCCTYTPMSSLGKEGVLYSTGKVGYAMCGIDMGLPTAPLSFESWFQNRLHFVVKYLQFLCIFCIGLPLHSQKRAKYISI